MRTPACPVSPSDINLYWNDEDIFMQLHKLEQGSPLPSNVYTDINPFRYKPSNLPGEIWYLVSPEAKKDAEIGLWKPRGEANEIFTNSSIRGWRTTLEFYEGKAPHGQKTSWMMQEYKISKRGTCDKIKAKDSRLLCRIFSTDDIPYHGTQRKHKNADAVGFNPMLTENSKVDSTRQCFDCKLQVKDNNDEMGCIPTTERSPRSYMQIVPEDCISSGDFLELDDLADSETSYSSELCDDLQAKNFALCICASARPNVVVCLAPSEDKNLDETATRVKKVVKDTGNGDGKGSSRGCNTVVGKKKASFGRKKKLRKSCFCFMPF